MTDRIKTHKITLNTPQYELTVSFMDNPHLSFEDQLSAAVRTLNHANGFSAQDITNITTRYT
jgi:hypothetical protein